MDIHTGHGTFSIQPPRAPRGRVRTVGDAEDPIDVDEPPLCCQICGEELEWEDCDRCGGDGFVEYLEAPEAWGEDCPSKLNHFVTCVYCGGTGGHLECPNVENHFKASQDDEGDLPDQAWLCTCGHYQEDGLHCRVCQREPPWGCDCSFCHDKALEAEDDFDFGELPDEATATHEEEA